MNFKKMNTVLMIAALVGTAAQAAKQKETKATPSTIEVSSVATEATANVPTKEDLEKYKKEIAKQRHPANSGLVPSEDLMSNNMRTFRDAFIAARTGGDINKLLTKLDTDYQTFEKSADFNNPAYADYRYFGARVLPFKEMAGYVWRMVPVVEDAKIRSSQEALLALIRSMAEQVKIHTPDSHHEAIFRFLTEPQSGHLDRFHTERQVQTFYSNTFVPALSKAIIRIRDQKITKPIVMDERLRFGDVSFPDSTEKRYRLIGEAEKAAVLARMYRRLATIESTCAYDFSEYLKIREEMGQLQGIDVIEFYHDIGGLTRAKRVSIVKNHKNFGTMIKDKDKDGHELATTKIAHTHLQSAYRAIALEAYYLNAGLSALEKEESNDNWLIEPETILSRRKTDESAVKTAVDLTSSNGPVTVKSALTGETVDVDLKNFFGENAPTDLKALMPTAEGFETGDQTTTTTIDGTSVEFRNYFYGRAKSWNLKEYQKLFPHLESGEGVAKAQDILSEARGGRVVANLIAPFVR